MAKVRMLGKIAIEKTVKDTPAGGASSSSIFKVPENLNNFGTVRFIAPELVTPDLFPGAQVYYGPKHEQLRIQGVDVLVMDSENVIATVTHETQEET